MKIDTNSSFIVESLTSDLSLLASRIDIHDQHGKIGVGTAFFAKVVGRYFLVTALHNFTGVHAYNGNLLKKDRRPTHAHAHFLISQTEGDTTRVSAGSFEIPLYSDDFQTPLWRVSPQFGELVDVASIPIRTELIEELNHTLIPEIEFLSPSNHAIGSRVTSIGFPDGLKTWLDLPIWKQGYIATEPNFPLLRATVDPKSKREAYLPAFLVDMMGRGGMSGAPVIFEYEGPIYLGAGEGDIDLNKLYDPRQVANEQSRPWVRHKSLIGINTGRVPGKIDDAPMCICYRNQEIHNICAGFRRGAHPHR